ncbi:hypothetical protein PSEUDO8AS_100292 [Pseudomonas sp. 8AS]|nr:hypothetical protein PSEUDO8AS_100292 [Pseudomonas sp. 8AS]
MLSVSVVQRLSNVVGANNTGGVFPCKPLIAKKLLSIEKLTPEAVSRFNRHMAHISIYA